MHATGKHPLSAALLIAIACIAITACATGAGNTADRNSGPAAPELPMPEPTAIEFKALGAGSSFPADKEEALGSISMYLLSRLTESPYFTVVLSDQERVLTGSVGVVEGRYQLSLYTVNYSSQEVESSVSVDFLSLKEFDYAVDIAVAGLEGREIRPAESITVPELALSGFELEGLAVSTDIPRIEASSSDDELRRMDGMLREILEQGDYHLTQGRYAEAAAVYRDFITRFDQGITGSFASRLGEIRNYARIQLEQATLLLSLADYERELRRVEEFYSAGQIRIAYRIVGRLSEKIALESGRAPELFEQILRQVRRNQVNLYTHVVKEDLGQVEEMVRDEAYNRAYFRLKNIRREIETNGFQSSIPDIYRAVLGGERELEQTCRNLLEAMSAGFAFNIGYYGFSGDEEGVRTSFIDFRAFLAESPFVHTAAPLFNDRLSYYASRYPLAGIDPVSSPAVTAVYTAGSAVKLDFLDAEEQISLLHLFGTPFLEVLTRSGRDPLTCYRTIKAMVPDIDREERLHSLLEKKPDLFYGSDELEEIGKLYRNYLEQEAIEWRDEPDLLVSRIDRRGYPLYFYHEEFDTADERSFSVLTLVRRVGDEYRIETLDRAASEGEYLDPRLHPFDLTVDRENNTAVCYMKEDALIVSIFSETGRRDYPGIKFLDMRLFWKLTGAFSQRFDIKTFRTDADGNPVIFYTDKKGFSVFEVRNGRWKSTLLDKEGGFAFLAADLNAYLVNGVDRLLFFRHHEGISSLRLVTRSGGSWESEELPAFAELSATLYESAPRYYFMNGGGAELSILVQNSPYRSSDPLLATLLKEEGKWRAVQWDFGKLWDETGIYAVPEGDMVETAAGPLVADLGNGSITLFRPTLDRWANIGEYKNLAALTSEWGRSQLQHVDVVPDGYGRLYLCEDDRVKMLFTP